MSNKAICEIDQAWEDFGKIDFTTSLYQQMGYDTKFEIDPAWEDFGKLPEPEEEWKARNEEWKAQDEEWKVQDEEWQARIDEIKKNTRGAGWEVPLKDRMLRDKDLRSRAEERRSRIKEVNKFQDEERRLMLKEWRKVRDDQWKVLDEKWKARLDELKNEFKKDNNTFFLESKYAGLRAPAQQSPFPVYTNNRPGDSCMNMWDYSKCPYVPGTPSWQ
jgi:hypothetical protein